jgi:electron transfer flavoprotein alpha subunit
MIVFQVSDVLDVVSEDTFVRPIYAGNAIATVKSKDPIKIFTVRTSAFEAAQPGDKEAEVVKGDAGAAGEGERWTPGAPCHANITFL